MDQIAQKSNTASRWSLHDPTFPRDDRFARHHQAQAQQAPKQPSKQKRRQGFENRTRQRAATGGLNGSREEMCVIQRQRASAHNVHSWGRQRRGSYGNAKEGYGAGPPLRYGDSAVTHCSPLQGLILQRLWTITDHHHKATTCTS